jgi:hypothetical protein
VYEWDYYSQAAGYCATWGGYPVFIENQEEEHFIWDQLDSQRDCLWLGFDK